MAITGKKRSTYELATTFLTSNGFYFTFLDLTQSDKSKRNKRISASNFITRLIALILPSYKQVTVSPSSLQSTGVGAIASYRSWRVEYTAERGTLYQEGNIRFYHDGTNIFKSSPDYIGDKIVNDMDLLFTMSISVGQMNLKINSDALDGNDIKLNYKVEAKPIAS